MNVHPRESLTYFVIHFRVSSQLFNIKFIDFKNILFIYNKTTFTKIVSRKAKTFEDPPLVDRQVASQGELERVSNYICAIFSLYFHSPSKYLSTSNPTHFRLPEVVVRTGTVFNKNGSGCAKRAFSNNNNNMTPFIKVVRKRRYQLNRI